MELKLIVPDGTKAITVSWIKEDFIGYEIGCHVSGTPEIDSRKIVCKDKQKETDE